MPRKLLVALLACLPFTAVAQVPEYQLKSVFLLNFTLFVDWPDTAFENAQAPFRICVIGDDPFGHYLDETVRGQQAAGRRIAILRLKHAQDAATCQILFIARSEARREHRILEAIGTLPILTVDDLDAVASPRPVIRFATVDRRIRFRIDLKEAQDAGLEISSRLLRLAEVTNGPGD